MTILVTNDDGINSPGIISLKNALEKEGHAVTVMAPDSNRSGVSNSLSLFNAPMCIEKRGPGLYACSGYPADCVLAGISGGLPGYKEKTVPDIVVSGINIGQNSGTDILYSGTCAAARQAVLMGIPGIAFSLAHLREYNWEMASSCAAGRLDEFLSYRSKDVFININIPDGPGPEGLKVTKPAVKNYNDKFIFSGGPQSEIKGRLWCYLEGGRQTFSREEESDCTVLLDNFISLSLIVVQPVSQGVKK